MNPNPLFQNEYVLWGCPKDSNVETLLVSTYKSLPITNKRIIEAMQKDLIQLGCTNVRIQEVDFSIDAMDTFVNSLISK